MSITRRRFLAGTAQAGGLGAVLASPGIYELVERLGRPVARPVSRSVTLSPEQHLMNLQVIPVDFKGVRKNYKDSVMVVVPPLHFQMVTAKVNMPASSLFEAQQQLTTVLNQLDQAYDPTTPAGLGVTVGWGLPYFRTYIPVLRRSSTFFPAGTAYPNYLPVDYRASASNGATTRAVLDAIQFPSDSPPAGFPGYPAIRLEANDVAVLLRSDSLANITAGASAIFGTGPGQAGSLFTVTSIRKGFVGGGFDGGQGLPKQMAMTAGIPGAQSIPDNAELFMGFASTQAGSLGSGVIANLESLPGLTDQWPNGYFKNGTAMHLSHLYLDLAGWYGRSAQDRVHAAFDASLKVPTPTQVVAEGPAQAKTEPQVASDLAAYGMVGHSESLQPATRLATAVTDNYGNSYAARTAVPQRSDFDSLDNPFFYTADPAGDGYSSRPAATLHFVVFTPTSDAFHRGRLAMDGHYPAGVTLNLDVRTQAGFNQFLHTTHRQNFLVPPRAHRSFPLAELLSRLAP
jgi:hypothetical protein